ncbi:MAG: histidine phosphatase family protein [Bacillota bacterium]|nr:histidine phosphatase family protein [Bacillota bacterium]
MDLILLRHGETVHNIQDRYSSDKCPLSERGRLQIERAADKLHKMIIDRAWVSPLARTRETFDIVRSYHDYPFEIKEDIQEIDAGLLKGRTFEEGMRIFSKEVQAYLDDPFKNALPQGESIEEAYARAQKVLKEAKSYSGNILIVSHGGFIALLLAAVIGDMEAYSRFEIANGSFSLIKNGDYQKISYINRI